MNLSDKIADGGLSTSDLFWIQQTLPAMSPEMTRLMVYLLLLDNARLRRMPRSQTVVSGSENVVVSSRFCHA